MFDLSSISLPPKGTLVDVGASTGEFYRLAAALMEPVQSLCVEMLGDLAAALRQNPQFHDPAHQRYVEHCACGEANGSAETRRTMFHQASSLLPCIEDVGRRLGHDMRQAPPEQQEIVRVSTLDFLCEKHGIAHIDLLKIDVQGYESRVLRGAKRILPHVDRVIIEVLIKPHYVGQSDQYEICSLLAQAGLRFKRELHHDSFPDTREILEVDNLYERV